MKLFKGFNSRIKDERNNVFEAMSSEENHQRELRNDLDRAGGDDEELERIHKEYANSVEHWKELEKHYKTYDDMATGKFRVSPDAVLTVVGGIAQIVLILNYEKIGIVTSKAMNYITKKRV